MMNVQTGEWRLEWVWRGSMESDGRSSFSTDSARNTENTENTENTGLQRLTETVTGVLSECGEQTGMLEI